MPTNYVVRCTFNGTCFFFVTSSHSFIDMLHFFYHCAVRHLASVTAFSADVVCLYVEVSLLGMAIRRRHSSKNTSGSLSNESLSQAEVVFTHFLF